MFDLIDYHVYFRHLPEEAGLVPLPYAFRPEELLAYRGRTQCIIQLYGKEVAVGDAFCSVNDNYSRKIGRYISFARAARCIEDKDARQMLWYEFRERGGTP